MRKKRELPFASALVQLKVHKVVFNALLFLSALFFIFREPIIQLLW